MASINELTKLFQSIASGDLVSAESVATQISEQEEHRGHHTAAQVLRGALRPNSYRANINPLTGNGHIHRSTSTLLASALTRVETDRTFSDVILRSRARDEFDQLVIEWRHQEALSTQGIGRRKKLLLHGPPGCGKSLAARVLGSTLSLPVFVVRFDAVVGAYLGQTALHLRELFSFAEATPCVLVVDEVDALAKKRGNPLDVGELDRIVITMMQELEHTNPAGYVVATSNLPRHLDEALWRRFDLVLAFPPPTKKELLAFASRRAKQRHVATSAMLKAEIAHVRSFADAERAVEAEARRVILARL